MIGRTVDRLLALVERHTKHRNRAVRRTAQLTVLALSVVRPPEGAQTPADGAHAPQAQFVDRLFASTRLRDYVRGRGFVRPLLGLGVRTLLLQAAANAKSRKLAQSDRRAFVLRVNGPVEQALMRNLLVWHNHVFSTYPSCSDGRCVDLMILLAQEENDARLFDLISIALMLDRVRNVAVFWDEEGIEAAAPMFMSGAEQARWRETRDAEDLRRLPAEIIDEVTRRGTSGGIKLLVDSRGRVQDFFKAALPEKFIIAVSLREDQDGTADPGDLGLWLPLFDAAAARHPNVAFVVLNRLAPSHWRVWPSHIRFARHQGLSMQDTLCLALVADGYVGALDIFGLAANAVARPGVYVPLMDGGGQRAPPDGSEQDSAPAQIMVASRDRARIEAALGRFLAGLPRFSGGALRGG